MEIRAEAVNFGEKPAEEIKDIPLLLVWRDGEFPLSLRIPSLMPHHRDNCYIDNGSPRTLRVESDGLFWIRLDGRVEGGVNLYWASDGWSLESGDDQWKYRVMARYAGRYSQHLGRARKWEELLQIRLLWINLALILIAIFWR